MNGIPQRSGASRVDQSNATRVLRVSIPADLRRKMKILQLKGKDGTGMETMTADEATTHIFREFFNLNPQ